MEPPTTHTQRQLFNEAEKSKAQELSLKFSCMKLERLCLQYNITNKTSCPQINILLSRVHSVLVNSWRFKVTIHVTYRHIVIIRVEIISFRIWL